MRFQISNFRWARIRRILVVLTLFGVGGWLLFRTGAGRDLVVRSMQTMAGGRVQLDGPSGDWPQRGQVARLAVSDAEGAWLVISNLTWQLDMRDLLRAPFQVREVRAEWAEVARLPTRNATTRPSRGPRLQLPEVRVAQLRGEPLMRMGLATALAVRVSVERNRAGWWVLGEAREVTTESQWDMALQAGSRTQVSLSVRETRGGAVTRYWPASQGRMTTTVWAERGASGWHGSLEAISATGAVGAAWQRSSTGEWSADVRATNVIWHLLARPLALRSGRLRWEPAARRGHYAVAGDWAGEPWWAEGVALRRPEEWSFPHMLLTADGVRTRAYVRRRDGWSAEARFSFQTNGAVQRWLPPDWDAEARGTLSWRHGALDVRAILPGVRVPAGRLDRVQVDLHRAADGVVTFDAGLATGWRGPHQLLSEVHVKGRLARSGADVSVELLGAQARLGNFPVALYQPFLITHDTHGWTWSTARWAVAEGDFTTTGRAGEVMNLRATWTNVPVASVLAERAPGLTGLWSGELNVRGRAGEPELDATTHLAELYVRPEVAGVEWSPADLQASFSVARGRGRLDVALAGWSDQPVRAEGEGPLRWSLRPWQVSVPRQEEGRASMRGRFELAQLERMFDLRGARLRGVVEGALDVSGSLEQPEVKGQVVLQDGRLDAPATGTSLRDIQVRLEGDRERLRIREGSARDAGDGRLRLEGDILFDPDQHFPVDARLRLQRAEVWQRGGSRAVVEGALRLTGRLRAWRVDGDLTVPEVEVKLGRRRAAVPSLPVQGLIESAVAPATRAQAPGWSQQVALGVNVRVPGRAEISGRGLEANWRAEIKVEGTLAAPAVSGGVQARRGYFLFMGRRFDLETAWVGLDGRVPPAPDLNVIATSRAGDLVARLQASGPLREPALELTSDPAFPQDEILSRLLFGKSADSISAFQAVRLAHGLNVVRGKGSTLDVLDRGQSLLRVDQLDLRQDSEQGAVSSVAVGKYIGRRVFVQGETALDGRGDVIAVDVDLAPSLTLQTEASPGIREGIGLKWRRDY